MRRSDARKMVMARWAQYHAYKAERYVLPALAYAKQMAHRGTLSPAGGAEVCHRPFFHRHREVRLPSSVHTGLTASA